MSASATSKPLLFSHCASGLAPQQQCNHSAERGLSNYLIYHSSKTDAKVAAHAADVGTYYDDEQGNLVKKQ